MATDHDHRAGPCDDELGFRRWLLTPVPVRVLAGSAGVGAMTVWRWRRRVLRELCSRRACRGAGEVHLARLGWRVRPWRDVIIGVSADGSTLDFRLGVHGPASTAADVLRRHFDPNTVLIYGGVAMGRLTAAARLAGFEIDRRRALEAPFPAVSRARAIRDWVRRFSVGPIRDPLGYCAWYEELHGRPQPPFPLPTPGWYKSSVS